MRALIVIDYTVDFVVGKLPVGEPGIAIGETIAALTRNFVDNGDFVVMAVDLHEDADPYHPEHKLFPPHNLRGTEGRSLYGPLEQAYRDKQGGIHWLDKTRYSAFAGTALNILLRERGITELHLAGVCTDICVLHTAVDAYNRGYGIVVHEDAVASFNAQGHEWALGHFRGTLGAQVITDYRA